MAVLSGLIKLGNFATEINASVYMPKIGCGLAGGTWDKMEPLIIEAIASKGISVTVYDFKLFGKDIFIMSILFA